MSPKQASGPTLNRNKKQS